MLYYITIAVSSKRLRIYSGVEEQSLHDVFTNSKEFSCLCSKSLPSPDFALNPEHTKVLVDHRSPESSSTHTCLVATSWIFPVQAIAGVPSVRTATQRSYRGCRRLPHHPPRIQLRLDRVTGRSQIFSFKNRNKINRSFFAFFFLDILLFSCYLAISIYTSRLLVNALNGARSNVLLLWSLSAKSLPHLALRSAVTVGEQYIHYTCILLIFYSN